MLNPTYPIIQPVACRSHDWRIRTRYGRLAHKWFIFP